MSQDTETLGAAPEPTAEELLAIPPRADDLAQELAARPARGRPSRITVALGAGVLVAAGFAGGVLVQKHYGGPGGGSGRAAAFASAFAGGRGSATGAAGAGTAGRGFGGSGGGGFGGTGGLGGGSITGSLTVVSGDTLYITAADGTVYTVKTSGSTSVSISASGSLSQLKPGQKVTVSGTPGSGGTVDATTITAGN